MQGYIYEGYRTNNNVVVTVSLEGSERVPLPLDLRLDLFNHSPTGAEWGYSGSGPAQLALAILAHHCGSDEQRALEWYQEFKRDIIANLHRDSWRIRSQEVENWLCIRAQPQRTASHNPLWPVGQRPPQP